MGTKYRMTPQVGGMLRARMRQDKMTLDELIHVVDVKVQQWKGCEDGEVPETVHPVWPQGGWNMPRRKAPGRHH